MKLFLPAIVMVLAAGCGGVGKQDLDQLERKTDADIKRTAADLERKITETDAKYANMLAMEQKVKIGLEQIQANAKLLESANERMVQILNAQRNALKEQLSSVETQLEALQKK